MTAAIPDTMRNPAQARTPKPIADISPVSGSRARSTVAIAARLARQDPGQEQIASRHPGDRGGSLVQLRIGVVKQRRLGERRIPQKRLPKQNSEARTTSDRAASPSSFRQPQARSSAPPVRDRATRRRPRRRGSSADGKRCRDRSREVRRGQGTSRPKPTPRPRGQRGRYEGEEQTAVNPRRSLGAPTGERCRSRRQLGRRGRKQRQS